MGTLRFAKGRHSRPEDDRWSTALNTLAWVHNLDIDSKGTIYTAEVETGKRVSKFTRVGG